MANKELLTKEDILRDTKTMFDKGISYKWFETSLNAVEGSVRQETAKQIFADFSIYLDNMIMTPEDVKLYEKLKSKWLREEEYGNIH